MANTPEEMKKNQDFQARLTRDSGHELAHFDADTTSDDDEDDDSSDSDGGDDDAPMLQEEVHRSRALPGRRGAVDTAADRSRAQGSSRLPAGGSSTRGRSAVSGSTVAGSSRGGTSAGAARGEMVVGSSRGGTSASAACGEHSRAARDEDDEGGEEDDGEL